MSLFFLFNHCILICCFMIFLVWTCLSMWVMWTAHSDEGWIQPHSLINTNSHQLFSPKLMFFCLKCLSSDHLYSSLDLLFLSTIISLCLDDINVFHNILTPCGITPLWSHCMCMCFNVVWICSGVRKSETTLNICYLESISRIWQNWNNSCCKINIYDLI